MVLPTVNKEAEKVKGFRLVCQHVLAVWLKLWLVWIRSWWMIILQLVVPFLLISAYLLVLEYIISFTPTIQIRPLSLEEG